MISIYNYLFGKKYDYYSIEEVMKHNQPNNCWIIVNKHVYDVSTFINNHPGGIYCLIKKTGENREQDIKFHSETAKKLMRQFHIGMIK